MRLILLLVFLNFSLKVCARSQTLAINPDKRIKAVISCDSMNRIAVVNDRITQVFGDNEAYEVLVEENTGQLFLKPTAQNGKKPLSVTLITENGSIQDMSLQPEEREAATLILKNPGISTSTLIEATGIDAASSDLPKTRPALQKFEDGQLGMHKHDIPGFGASLDWQEQVISAMKSLVSDAAPIMDENINEIRRHGPKEVETQVLSVYNLGNFKGLKLNVKNITDGYIDILEKDFLQNQDLALLCTKRVLNPGESTLLYVVVR